MGSLSTWYIPPRSLGRVPRAAAQRLSGTRCDRQSLVFVGARPFFLLASGILVGLDKVTRNDTTWHVHVAHKDATVQGFGERRGRLLGVGCLITRGFLQGKLQSQAQSQGCNCDLDNLR